MNEQPNRTPALETGSDHPGTAGAGLTAPVVTSPWLWGGLLTWGFYAVLPYSPYEREMLARYFTSHPTEYVLAGLFFVGVSILVAKAWRLMQERRGLELPLPQVTDEGSPIAWVRAIQHAREQLPETIKQTGFQRRLRDLADFLGQRQSTEGLDDYAKYLSTSAVDRTLDSYSLLQTVTWAVPIMGFLGTVMGITMAIANVTPDQLDKSLSEVTGGLAIAFDTTAIALSESIVLVFGYFFVKRSELNLLGAIEERVLKGLVSPLVGAETRSSPLIEAESRAAQDLLNRTETLIEQQTHIWQESVEGLRTRWVQTLDSQQRELSTALSGGVTGSLEDHARLLQDLRQEFTTAWQRTSQEAAHQMHESRAFQSTQQRELQAAIESTWHRVEEQLVEDRRDRERQTCDFLDRFSHELTGVTSQLSATTSGVQEQIAALHRQTEMLARIVDQEEQLAGLQSRLTDNLSALRTAETMQETLHSLNAAIHLLTARTRPHAA